MVAVVPTERIRNVLVVGHTGTGKSTLVEAMLGVAGHASHGSGCPTVDHEPEEAERGHSLSLALATLEFDGHRINLLDAPGGAEALADVYPAVPAADVALFVVDATVGVQPQHEQIWAVCEERGLPRVVFLNKLDLERADHTACVDDLRDRYGRPLAPVQTPMGVVDPFDGIVDLLHMLAVEVHDGVRVEEPIPEAYVAAAEAHREALVEAVVENDDDLLARYLDGETPSVGEIAETFAHGVAQCGFFPVLCGSATLGIGVELLLHFLIEECPSPAEDVHGLPHDGPTAVYVAKTFSDPYVGRINLLRVLSGGLRRDDELLVARTGARQRLHQLFGLRGRTQLPYEQVAAGDLVAVAKLDDVATGDVLTADGQDLPVPRVEVPEGHHRVVLEPTSAADDEKLSTALARLAQEDPGLRVTLDAETRTRVVHLQGSTHLEVTLARLARRNGLEVDVAPAPVAYHETARRPATGLGRHVKQSGGHGQYGIAHIELRPLPPGEGFVFEDAIVGGAIPGTYIPSVEKGVREAMREGPVGGYPVVDVAVRLVDGKSHSVDSSDAAFQMAGILAFRAAMADADPVLLEPLSAVDVLVPEDLTGGVMSELSARRGRILGSDPAGPGRVRVTAHVPEVELQELPARLRALTSGRAQLTMRPDHHEPVPDDVARRLLGEMSPA